VIGGGALSYSLEILSGR